MEGSIMVDWRRIGRGRRKGWGEGWSLHSYRGHKPEGKQIWKTMLTGACSFDEDQSGSLFRSSFRVLNLEKERINEEAEGKQRQTESWHTFQNVLKTYLFGDGR
jgi:hypothetical protein